MSTGHRHADLPTAEVLAMVTPEMEAWVERRASSIPVDRTYDVVWLAGRSQNCTRVYIDCDAPLVMTDGETGFDPGETLPWHEVAEWYGIYMLGLQYPDAHALATHRFERPRVEKLGLDWDGYETACDEAISENATEPVNEPPPDIDLSPYEEDGSGKELALMRGDESQNQGLMAAAAVFFRSLFGKEQPSVGDVHATSSGKGRGKKRKPLIPAVVGDVGKGEAGEFEFAVAVTKVDQAQQMIFGWASVSSVNGEDIIDKQGDIVPIEALEKGVYDYVLYSREHGDMHSKVGCGKLIESMVFTPKKAAAGITARNENGEPMMGWWGGWKILDKKVWDAIAAGDRPELSIGGRATSVQQ
jgi:hypothetical protein